MISPLRDTMIVFKVNEVNFDKVIEYDNKCFISQNFKPRHDFLRLWTQIPNGATYVALNSEGRVIGFGCRRPAVQSLNHLVGPLYADSADVAEALLCKLCSGVRDETVTMQIW